MAAIIPKKSTVAGKVPTSNDLGLGEICLNHADHLLYSRHPGTGAVYAIGGASAAVERFWAFALIGNAIYLGPLAASMTLPLVTSTAQQPMTMETWSPKPAPSALGATNKTSPTLNL